MSIPWYEKYRPKSLNEVVGQEHITAVLEDIIRGKGAPRAFLILGPSGVGKTIIVKCFANDYFRLCGAVDEKGGIFRELLIKLDGSLKPNIQSIRSKLI